MTLEELEVYMLTVAIGERVWAEVVPWDFSAKDTVGESRNPFANESVAGGCACGAQ